MTALNDAKYASLETQTGLSTHIQDMFLAWLQINGATSDQVDDAEREMLLVQGAAPAHLNDMWYELTGLMGYTGSLNDRMLQFWEGGGSFGPTASITQTIVGSCDYQFPSTDCATSSTFVGASNNFTNPADTWVWNVIGATIASGQGTNTIVVNTTSGADVPFTVDLTATDSVSTDTADAPQKSVNHNHDDTSAFAFIGPDIGDLVFLLNDPFTLDVSAKWNPAATSYQLIGAWPPGFAINASGVITGTAVTETNYPTLSVRAGDGATTADSDIFNATVSAVAEPAFHALTPDPDTQEMKGVLVGVGDLATVHTATIYAPDRLGVYNAFVANEPVWAGGWHGSNSSLNSNNCPLWTNGADSTFDQVGIDGAPNTASRVVATVQQNFAVTVLHVVIKIWIAKTVEAGTVQLQMNQSTTIQYNFTPSDGTLTPTNGAFVAVEVVDYDADWWIVLFEHAMLASSFTGAFYIRPDFGSISAITVGNFEVHDGKAIIPSVSGFPHIITTTDPIAQVFNKHPTTGATLVGAAIPYLQYQPAAENDSFYSHDSVNNKTYYSSSGLNDAVGLDGVPNGAITLSCNGAYNASVMRWVSGAGMVGNATDSNTFVYYISKASVATKVYTTQGGAIGENNSSTIELDMATGATSQVAVTGAGAEAFEAVDVGLWWKLIVEHKKELSQGWGSLDINADNGGVSSCVIGNIELHLLKTVADVRGLGPIFTTTAAVITDETVKSLDAANSADTPSTWYFDALSDDVQNVLDGFVATVGTNLQLSDGTTPATQPWVAGQVHKVGVVYDATLMTINVDGTYSADVAYDGTMLQGTLDLFRAGVAGGKLRNLRRYDIATYQAGKDIIDDLMLPNPNAFITQHTVGAGEAVVLPLAAAGTYDFQVEWGDGSFHQITAYNQAEATHVYAAAGTYDVKIVGTLTHWNYNTVTTSRDKVVDILQWGNTGFTNLASAFQGCTALVAVSAVDGAGFSEVTLMNAMFQACTALTGALDFSAWDTAKCTRIDWMFYQTIPTSINLNGWDTSKVTSFSYTFFGIPATSLNLASWRGDSATAMLDSFAGCKVTSLDLSLFNTPILSSNSGTFNNMTELLTIDVSGMNQLGALTNAYNIFANCTKLTTIIGTQNWDMSAVTRMDNICYNCNALTSINVTGWNLPACTTFQSGFRGLSVLASLDTASWTNVGAAASLTFNTMFQQSTLLSDVDISGFDVTKLTTAENMFVSNTAWTTAHYDAMLAAWSAQVLANGILFHAGDAQYTNAAARLILTDAPNSWIITDGGPV